MHAPKQMVALISARLAQHRNGPLRRQPAPFRGVNCTLHRFTRRTVISTVLRATDVTHSLARSVARTPREYAIRVRITRDEYGRTDQFRCGVRTNALENRLAARNHASTSGIEAPPDQELRANRASTFMARAEFLRVAI